MINRKSKIQNPKSPSPLDRIAVAMCAVAAKTGQPQQHRLSHGLTLTLRYTSPLGGTEGGWTLSLTRPAVQPGPNEETICRAAFSVPETASRQELTKQNKFAKDYFIVRLTWPVAEQLSFAAPAAAPAGNNYRVEG